MKLRSFIEKVSENGTETVPCFTCAHCNTIVEHPKPDSPMGFCMRCFYPVCLACGALTKCEPFEKKLLRAEARARFLASVGTAS